MADKRISELEAITGANTAADDFFLVVDTSGAVTKKISRAELNNAIEQDVLSVVDINGGTIDGTVLGGSSAAAGTFTTFTSTGIDDNASSTAVTINSSQNVGIGTSAPTAKADILTTTAAPTSAIWTAQNLTLKDDTAYASGVGGALTFEGKFNAAGSYSTFGYIRGSKTDASDGGFQGGIVYGARNGNHVFVTNSGGLTDGTDERMRITSAGRLGLGVSAPAQELHVVGKTRIQRSSNATLEITSDNNTGPNPFAIGSNSDLFFIKNQAASGLGTGGNFIEYDEGGSIRLMGTNYITSSGRVGINRTSPTYDLDVNGAVGMYASSTETRNLEIGHGRTGNGFSYVDLIGDATYTDYGLRLIRGNTGPNTSSELTHRGTGPLVITAFDAGYIDLRTANTNRLRITGTGLVGINNSTPTRHLSVNGSIQFASGGVIEAGTTTLNTYIAGVEGASGRWAFATNAIERLRIQSNGVVRPGTDNLQPIGAASYRWSVVYAGTGTINTSDEREKQQIADLDDAERRVAVAIKGLVKKYKYNDAVALKGDDARIHVGVIAQEVIAAFAAEGLDATRYALLCHDTWEAEEEETDDEGNVINPAHDAGERYGIRYDELLAFMIAAL